MKISRIRDNLGLQCKILPYLVGLSVALVTLAVTILTFVAPSSRVRIVTTPRTGCAGHAGGAVTSTAPEPAMTSGKQPKTREHDDLRMEYRCSIRRSS